MPFAKSCTAHRQRPSKSRRDALALVLLHRSLEISPAALSYSHLSLEHHFCRVLIPVRSPERRKHGLALPVLPHVPRSVVTLGSHVCEMPPRENSCGRTRWTGNQSSVSKEPMRSPKGGDRVTDVQQIDATAVEAVWLIDSYRAGSCRDLGLA